MSGEFTFGFAFDDNIQSIGDTVDVSGMSIGVNIEKPLSPHRNSVPTAEVDNAVILDDLTIACPVSDNYQYDNYIIPFGELYYGKISNTTTHTPRPITFDYEGDVEDNGQLGDDIDGYIECTDNKLFKCLRSNEQIETGLDKAADIIIGLYEGGYKVWECSIDLVEYITTNIEIKKMLSDEASAPIDVLELGCGNGFPGIICLKHHNVKNVVFSDLNKEVVEEITWPNIILNCKYLFEFSDYENSIRSRVQCYHGDWSDLSASLYNAREKDSSTITRFSLLLSAETLYNEKVCAKLFHMILFHLKIDGIAVISSKRYYFGVGGGTRDLMNMVDLYNVSIRKRRKKEVASGVIDCDIYYEDRELTCQVASIFEDGKSNIREILILKWVNTG